MPIKITYDGQANAAYIYLKFPIGPGEVKRTYQCDPADEVLGGYVNLDLDASDKLIGIEVLGASYKLPKAILDEAEIIG